MLIRTAVSQLTGEISLMNANDMGQDLMEISAHIGARPSHAHWQGKIVSLSGTNPKYLTLEDIEYGEVRGFKGAIVGTIGTHFLKGYLIVYMMMKS